MRHLLRTDLGRARLLLFVVIGLSAAALGWLGKQTWDVHRLTRGVGDTWFYAADGKAWFRLDEQRHDVPITAIAPHLQHAFVAVEDHRFFRHPGVDPIALAQDSPALLLIQRIRDEAHRFAVTFHRQSRTRRDLRSEVDEIRGIGPRRRKALLTAFRFPFRN